MIVSLGLVAALAGCNSTRWNWLKPADTANAAAIPPGNVQSVASLVEYLNDNASRVKTYRADDMTVTVTQGPLAPSFTVNGKMVAEKPLGFRMSLEHGLKGQVVDLGSNNDEFWYWISQANPPYQFYCSYRELEQGVKFLPIPFQPQWIMETMGIGQYGPPERYQREHDAQTVRLIERTRSPQGRPIRKVIVLRRREAKPPEPQVLQYLLIDEATNKEICSAHITETMVDIATGAILPRRIELNWPQEKAKLSMILNGSAVNTPVPATAFVRQPLNGVPSYNLARMQLDPGFQRAQGVAPGPFRRQ
jgi:hypothetical protein